MSRVKRGAVRARKRKKVLAHPKGFKWRRKNVYSIAVDAARHAMARSFEGRKLKKRSMRALWQIKISAGAKENNTTYSKLIHALKENGVELDRKILADIAQHHPETFKKIIDLLKK